MGIVLIGMMGCGKTTLGRELAKRLHWRHVDLDSEVVRLAGSPIPDIFSKQGEETFRRFETEALRSIVGSGSLVLSVGGGAPTREENWVLMRRVGPIVYLRASAELLIKRLESSRKERPLLSGPNWHGRLYQLLEQRESFYARADHTLDLDRLGRRDVLQRLLQIAQGDQS